MDFGIATVAAIAVISYLVGMAVKSSGLDNKWIPVICGGVGLILGIVSLYCNVPDFPANDPITAAAVGIASGLAATGINQMYKQLTNKDNSDSSDSSK